MSSGRRVDIFGPGHARLGLGMAALGRPGYMTLGHASDFASGRTREAMRARAHAVLDAAFARGIRYVDVARSYGDAEAFVRSWLDARGLRPGVVTVGSKWGYIYEAGWQVNVAVHERKDHSVANLERQVEESRAHLGEHLALYQIHSATLESGVLDDARVLDGLARLRASGLSLGISVSGPLQARVIERAVAIERDGAPLFASIQATWNLLERSSETALRDAHDAGRAIIVKEPLANGRLTVRGDAGTGGEVAALAQACGVTPDVIALAAALEQPWADMILLGASTVEQLESNVRALDLVFDPAELARLDSVRVPAEVYWRDRSRLPWT